MKFFRSIVGDERATKEAGCSGGRGGLAPPRDEAGWDEDSFDKVLLRQRSLPSLRAITPTISHKESGRFYRGSL